MTIQEFAVGEKFV